MCIHIEVGVAHADASTPLRSSGASIKKICIYVYMCVYMYTNVCVLIYNIFECIHIYISKWELLMQMLQRLYAPAVR